MLDLSQHTMCSIRIYTPLIQALGTPGYDPQFKIHNAQLVTFFKTSDDILPFTNIIAGLQIEEKLHNIQL